MPAITIPTLDTDPYLCLDFELPGTQQQPFHLVEFDVVENTTRVGYAGGYCCHSLQGVRLKLGLWRDAWQCKQCLAAGVAGGAGVGRAGIFAPHTCLTLCLPCLFPAHAHQGPSQDRYVHHAVVYNCTSRPPTFGNGTYSCLGTLDNCSTFVLVSATPGHTTYLPPAAGYRMGVGAMRYVVLQVRRARVVAGPYKWGSGMVLGVQVSGPCNVARHMGSGVAFRITTAGGTAMASAALLLLTHITLSHLCGRADPLQQCAARPRPGGQLRLSGEM